MIRKSEKGIRKSLYFRPDFPYIGPIIPRFLLDNPGTQKKGSGYKGMRYDSPHFLVQERLWRVRAATAAKAIRISFVQQPRREAEFLVERTGTLQARDDDGGT